MKLDIIIKGGEELEKFYPKKYETFKEKLAELVLDTFHGVGGCCISSEPPGAGQATEKLREQKEEDSPKYTMREQRTTYYYCIIIAALIVGVCIGWFAHTPLQTSITNVSQTIVPVQAPIIQKTLVEGSNTASVTIAIPTPTVPVTPKYSASGNTAAAIYQRETSL